MISIYIWKALIIRFKTPSSILIKGVPNKKQQPSYRDICMCFCVALRRLYKHPETL